MFNFPLIWNFWIEDYVQWGCYRLYVSFDDKIHSWCSDFFSVWVRGSLAKQSWLGAWMLNWGFGLNLNHDSANFIAVTSGRPLASLSLGFLIHWMGTVKHQMFIVSIKWDSQVPGYSKCYINVSYYHLFFKPYLHFRNIKTEEGGVSFTVKEIRYIPGCPGERLTE